MNLSFASSVFAGGPGSGCRGPNCGRPQLTLTVRKNPATGNFRIVPTDKSGKEVGWLMISLYNGRVAYVDGANLDKQYRRKGYGKAMYKMAIDELKQNPQVKWFTSSGTLSTDADRVWQSLAKEYPVVYKDGGYELRLR